MSINHDEIFKSLLSVFFVEFIELFFPEAREYIDPESVEFLQQELLSDVIDGSTQIVDLVVKVKFKDKDSFFLINVEPQSSNTSEFDRRFFKYFARLDAKYKLPVYPIALFTFDKPYKERENGYKVVFPDFQVLDFRYRAVQLNRLNWREYLRQENPVASALMAKMNIHESERAQVKAECLRLLATFKIAPARKQLISAFIDTYLPLNEAENEQFLEIVKEFSENEGEKIMELTTSWEQKGIEKGLQQGIEKGTISLVTRQLTHKLGNMELDLQNQVKSLPLERVEALAEALLDFKDFSDLQNWLKETYPTSSEK